MRHIAITLLLLAGPLQAAETMQATPGATPPPAKISDLAWLAGEWTGDGIGGEPAREVYSPPAGGQIVGHYSQLKGNQVAFYEIIAIAEAGGSLEYRIKHFNADLTGWEEKNQVQRFPLVSVSKDAWYFDGLTLRRDGDGLVSAVRIKHKDGTSQEIAVRYRRAR